MHELVLSLDYFWLMLCCTGCVAYNLGTGRGTTVLEIVAAFEKASGKVADNHLALLRVLEVGCLLDT